MLRRGSETVLLVEDDEAVRELTCEVLEMHGYTVLAVADAGEAPRVLEGASRPIHLLVTDVVMPLELSDLRGAASLVQPMAPRAPRRRVAQRPRALSSPRTWMP